MPSFSSHSWSPLLNSYHLILIIFGCCCTEMLIAECPRLCECKWKSGKESVICLNANLSMVPLHLEAGTQILDLTGNINLIVLSHDAFSSAGLLNLQKVYIAKCRLKSLERYAFRNLFNLVELDLSYNVLTSVPSHIFDSISELRELKLNGNPIQEIIHDTFINVPQLIRLELAYCRINQIQLRAFHGLENTLEWLKLDQNKLIEVNPLAFTVLDNLHGLELAQNPWNCSCTLRPLREWMLRQNVPFGIPPTCQHPKRLQAKPWDKLDLDEFACAPEIIANDHKAHSIEGRNVTMRCQIAGVPEPSVRWLNKNNKVIANLSGPSAYNNGKKLYVVHLQNTSSDLTIFSVDLQDAGSYICAAENKAGRAEATVTLAITKKQPDQYQLINRKIVIASVVTGIGFVLISCFITYCVCSVLRTKQLLFCQRWRRRRNNRGECRVRDDNNYEKIEMNNHHHKLSIDNSNGGVIGAAGDISVVANRRNGEYHVVPSSGAAVDTDQEMDEEIDYGGGGVLLNNEQAPPPPAPPSVAIRTTSSWGGGDMMTMMMEKPWNSPERILDPEDLHIPRRTLQEARDDINRNYNSTCGTYNSHFLPSSTNDSTQGEDNSSFSSSMQFLLRIQAINNNINQTTPSQYESTTTHQGNRHYPDLLENSGSSYNTSTRLTGVSAGDLTSSELFCTLPRSNRGKLIQQKGRCRSSSDSQSSLLPADSRYGSSCSSSGGGGDESEESNSCYPMRNHHHHHYDDNNTIQLPKYSTIINNKRDFNNKKVTGTYYNSCLNLATTTSSESKRDVVAAAAVTNVSSPSTAAALSPAAAAALNSTPLLDVSSLENRSNNPTSSNNYCYDYYHATQLERFLDEYRSLQEQLTKMKDLCDNIDNGDTSTTKSSPSTVMGTSTILDVDYFVKNIPLIASPSSQQHQPSASSSSSVEDSIDFRNFESELTKYLLAENSSSSAPRTLLFNNKNDGGSV